MDKLQHPAFPYILISISILVMLNWLYQRQKSGYRIVKGKKVRYVQSDKKSIIIAILFAVAAFLLKFL